MKKSTFELPLPRTPKNPRCDRIPPPRDERGIALFVVMVLVVVLSIVISQLVFTAAVEKEIAENRKGFLEQSYAMQSIARDVIVRVHADWMHDLEGASGSTGAGGADPLAGLDGLQGTIPSGQAPGGAAADADSTPVDTRHERDWAHPYQQNLNEVDFMVRIQDGEGRLDLNQIFWYVAVDEEDNRSTEGTTSIDEEPEPPAADGEGDAPEDEQEELQGDYGDPSEARIDLTRAMLARLVEATIAHNQDLGFYYDEVPNPETVASDIVRFLQDYWADDAARRILRVECLRVVVGAELFDGPRDPAEDEDEDGIPSGDDAGFDRDGGFGLGGSGFDGLELGGLDALSEVSGYRQVDTGVEEIERPLGLGELFTAHAQVQDEKPGTGRKWPALNLNTCRPEVLMALMVVSFEEFDEALDVALQINDYLNSLPVEEEDDPSSPPLGTTPDDSTTADEATEEAEPELNYFTQFADLEQVNEEEWVSDTEELAGEETSVFNRLKHDLENCAVFKSTFFTAYIQGTQGGLGRRRPIEGELVVKREEADDRKWVRVLYWRENLKP
ncbi:MAG: hypothetical protein AB7O52_12350 [Planctomycetota bacterium]